MVRRQWVKGVVAIFIIVVVAMVGLTVVPAMADEEEATPTTHPKGMRGDRDPARLQERLAAVVESGRITQEQVDQILAAVENGEWPSLGLRGHGLKGMRSEFDPARLGERLAAAVESGKITQEQADQIKQFMKDKIDSRGPGGPPFRGGPGGHFGFRSGRR